MPKPIYTPMGTGAIKKVEETTFEANTPIWFSHETDRVIVVQKGKVVGTVLGHNDKATLSRKWVKKLKKGLFSKTVNCDVYYVDAECANVKFDEQIKLNDGYTIGFKTSLRISATIKDFDKWYESNIADKNMLSYFELASFDGYMKALVKKGLAKVASNHFSSNEFFSRKLHSRDRGFSSNANDLDKTDKDIYNALEKFLTDELEEQGRGCIMKLAPWD